MDKLAVQYEMVIRIGFAVAEGADPNLEVEGAVHRAIGHLVRDKVTVLYLEHEVKIRKLT